MKIFNGLLWIVCVTPILVHGQGFTLEQVMSAPHSSALTTTQSGRIAWVFAIRGERNVWVADPPKFEARQVTRYQGDDGQQIASVRLTPDGKTVVYARGSETNREGRIANPTTELKEPKQQVWAAEVESGKTQLLGDMGCEREGCEDIQISPDGHWVVWPAKHHLWLAPVPGDKPARQLTELRGTDVQPRWSPDGRHILFVSGRGDHSLIAIYDFSPERVRYVAPSTEHDFDPQWSPDGRQLVFIRTAGSENHLPLILQRPHPWALWLADAETGQARELWHSSNDMNGSLPHFATTSLKFAAGGRIVFDSEQDGRNHLYSVSAEGGQPTLLTPGDFDVEDVELTATRNEILYSSNQDDIDRRHIWRVDVSGGTPKALTSGKSIEWSPIMTGDGKTIVCLGSTANLPGMPYRLTSGGKEMIGGDILPKDFPSAQLIEPQQVTFHSDDGLEIHGQLFVPRERAATRSPAVIFVHGGPIRQMVLGFHYGYYYHNAYAQNQYLASLGYVVLSVNYRLGIMYGRAFREAPNSGWRGSAEYKDVLAGAKYLQGLSYVDPKRIGIWGGSYGGLLTALALSRNSDVFAAGVDFHGVHDWSVFLNRWESDPQDAPDYKEAYKLAFDSSPVATVAQWRSPVLLIHGDDDRNVSFQQTTDLAQRLKQQHVNFEELIFPDEIHDFLLWKSWVSAYHATADFLNQKLGNSSPATAAKR